MKKAIDSWDGRDELSIGHAGVLLESRDGGLYFIEKLAFQEPYRPTRFGDRAELKRCLMNRFDVSRSQDTVPAFILENDRLMED